ncbi:MAG: DUF305 domain-containing protein [Candidatus Sericytochromatia bacterium]|nr:DUF305 domain-containing protein [Candidatus Sericytochromatia bacterium]
MTKRAFRSFPFAVLTTALLLGCPSVPPPVAPSPAASVAPSVADQAFIDGMVPHHEGAVMMADEALRKATREELRAFARQVKADQGVEIAQMKAWRLAWFGSDKTPPMDHAAHHVSASGAAYDAAWCQAMVAHHEGALTMSADLLKAAARPEVRDLAQRIIVAQEREIIQLKAWAAAWR